MIECKEENNEEMSTIHMKYSSCYAEFFCIGSNRKDCVYFMKDSKHEDCKHLDGRFCNSVVAQVNRMTLETKERIK